MPVPHLEIRIVQRSKGSSAVVGAAYQAGEKLLEAISKVKINESKVIDKYRNMDLEVSYNFFTNEHNFSLNGAAKHSGELGTSADGNITRLDNALEKMPEKLKRLKEKLIGTKEQMKGRDEKKESVLGAIKKYQAEDKEKPKEKKETSKEAER